MSGLGGCPERRETGPAASPAPAATAGQAGATGTPAGRPDLPPPPHGEGIITGTVRFSGPPPEMPLLRRDGDPVCGRTPMKSESVIVAAGGGLKNVLVSVTAGVRGVYPPPARPVVIDQRECMYRPRVSTAVAGQLVQVRNGDQTLHNVHALRGPSTLFNKVQMNASAPAIEFAAESGAESGPNGLSGAAGVGQGGEMAGPGQAGQTAGQPGRPGEMAAGTLLKLRCDVHQWMVGYLYVADHPFVAVTGEDGGFTLSGLPDGAYTVTAWHEALGTRSAHATVAAGRPARLTFSYPAGPP